MRTSRSQVLYQGIVCTTALVLVSLLIVTHSPAGGAEATEGVTPTTVSVGIPYIDFSSLHVVGISLNQGNFPEAYTALINRVNAQGGIAGRKIVPYFVPVNPTGTAGENSACTQLVQDDHIFVALAPLQADCYVQNHVPTIGAQVPGALNNTTTPNFTLIPPANAYDPLQLKVFAGKGIFKGKKVGVVAGESIDQGEFGVVTASLRKLHVDVVSTAIDSAPASDQAAATQQMGVIAQKFKAAGVNEVVAVGTGSAAWPTDLHALQSTYNPPWIATSVQDVASVASGNSSVDPTYLKDVLTTSPAPSADQIWNSAPIQSCVKTVRKAYPRDVIDAPSNPQVGSKETYLAVEQACQDLAIFTTIAKGAGKNLTTNSFSNAGYKLRNVVFPGEGGAVSFGPGQPYGLGSYYIVTYSPATKSFKYSLAPS